MKQKEIAELVGVSVATVSLALRDSDKVNKKTKEKIKRIAELLNYKPNEIARSLVCKKTNIIGIIIPTFSITYYTEFAYALQNNLRKKGFFSLIMSGNKENIKEIIEMFLRWRVEGIITNKIGFEILRAVKIGIPVVLYEKVEEGDYVSVNKFKGGYKATEHLIKIGYRKIGFLCSPYFEEERTRGYIEALSDYGISIDKKIIFPGLGYFEEGYKGAKELLKKGIEGIFCLNDVSAIGAIRALKEENVRIPEDIGIVGFDNIEESKYIYPSLTTVNQPKEKIAEKIVEILLKKLNERTERSQILIDPELIIRESCGYKKRKGVKI